MAEDSQRGLFYPGSQAATAPPAVRPVTPAAPAAPEAATEPAGAPVRVQKKKHFLSRRLAIRWAGWGSLLLLLAGWGNGFLSFFYPNKTGAFGSVITAGTVEEFEIGEVKAVTEGKFFVTRVPEGFVALWWKCPHLGCTVPWKENDPVSPQDAEFAQQGRFNCPCHGSIYDRYGQIVSGPAPRPMDAFPITIENGRIRVQSGQAITRTQAGPTSPVIARV